VIVQRVNAERVVLLGWSRAILMQLAHPLIAAGVIEHSSFRGSAVEAAVRLHHTVAAMLSLTFGDDGQRAAAIAGIRAIHRRVNGTLARAAGRFAAGTRYSAEDPELLLWVHATLVDSNTDAYRRLVAPLSDEELDRVCVESAPILEELGGDTRATPRSWAALRSYMDTIYSSQTLALTDEARALGRAVLSPRAAGLPLPLSGAHRLVATGLLPPVLREAYGFEWNAAREARFRRTLKAVRAARRLMPRAIAYWPQARRLPVSAAPPPER
jgi:uncharacterized protein (DUF2236 family)